jgi:hypothetical protein
MHATGLKVATHFFTRCFKTRNLRTHNRSQIRFQLHIAQFLL